MCSGSFLLHGVFQNLMRLEREWRVYLEHRHMPLCMPHRGQLSGSVAFWCMSLLHDLHGALSSAGWKEMLCVCTAIVFFTLLTVTSMR